MSKTEDIKVFVSNRNSTCDDCGENLGAKAWITLDKKKGALCLVCADIDHLAFLPSGDTALTRRARKNSTLVSVVLKWSRARKQNERQGLLVEEKALQEAEKECWEDSDARARNRKRQAERRAELDQQYIEQFGKRIKESFPRCPSGRERTIAEHACLKYSGRIGRSESAKNLDEQAVRLAVIAHVRHHETNYDFLLATGHERNYARMQVEWRVFEILKKWK